MRSKCRRKSVIWLNQTVCHTFCYGFYNILTSAIQFPTKDHAFLTTWHFCILTDYIEGQIGPHGYPGPRRYARKDGLAGVQGERGITGPKRDSFLWVYLVNIFFWQSFESVWKVGLSTLTKTQPTWRMFASRNALLDC